MYSLPPDHQASPLLAILITEASLNHHWRGWILLPSVRKPAQSVGSLCSRLQPHSVMFLRCAVQEHERTASHLANSSLGTWMCVSGGGAYCSHVLSIPQQPHRIPTLFTHPPGPQSPIHFSFFLDFPSFSILCLRTLPSPASLETLQVSCFAGFFPLASALGSGESGEVQIRKVKKEEGSGFWNSHRLFTTPL